MSAPSGAPNDPHRDLAELDSLLGRIADGIGVIHDPAPVPSRSAPSEPAPAAPSAWSRAGKLEILRYVLELRNSKVTPRLDASAPLGHSCPEIDRMISGRPGDSLALLEDLADLGLLERSLHNRIHVCPSCRRCHINFRESCPGCTSIDLDIETLIHHFECAHTGLESEFANGINLTCPKCHETLDQLGQDFERPHETYTCRSCHRLFPDPTITGQCLHCTHVFSARDAELVTIHSYSASTLAPRAVEAGRLTGLEVSEFLFDRDGQFAHRDYLLLEARRELYRLRRSGNAMSAAMLVFETDAGPYPVFREWSSEAIRTLGRMLKHTLRELDVAAPAGAAHLTLLLPDTDAAGAETVMSRVQHELAELSMTTSAGHPITTRGAARTWTEAPATEQPLIDFLTPPPLA